MRALSLIDCGASSDDSFWHLADLLPIVRNVRCRRMNGPAQDAAEGLSLTHNGYLVAAIRPLVLLLLGWTRRRSLASKGIGIAALLPTWRD